MASYFFKAAFFLFLFGLANSCNSIMITLNLKPVEGLTSGIHSDGTLLAEGEVTVDEYPTTLKILVNETEYVNGSLRINSLNNTGFLSARLENVQGEPILAAAKLDSGILRFRLVTAGDQYVKSDSWRISINTTVSN